MAICASPFPASMEVRTTATAFSSPLKPGPSSLAALGPSPRSRHRRAKLLHGAWDLFHLGCVAAVSLHIFAADRRRTPSPP